MSAVSISSDRKIHVIEFRLVLDMGVSGVPQIQQITQKDVGPALTVIASDDEQETIVQTEHSWVVAQYHGAE